MSIGFRAAAAVVASMTAVQALATLSVLALAAAAPAVADDLGLSPSLIGYQITVIYFGALMTSVLGGTVPRRLGAVRASQIALALAALGCLVATLPGLWFLALGSVMIGWCYGLTNPAASQLMIRVATPARRNLVFSIKQTGVPLGGVMAGLIAPPVVLMFGWQGLLTLVAAGSLALAVALQPMRARWDAERDGGTRLLANPLGALVWVWRNPGLRYLSLGGFFFAAIQLCGMTYTVTLLVEEGGMGLVQAGFVLSVLQAAGVFGRVFWGWVADRVRDGFLVLVFVGFVMLAATAAASLVEPGWTLLPALVVFGTLGLSAAGWNGVMMGETARLVPQEEVARATGGTQFFAFGGVMCGPAGFALAYAAIGSYAGTFLLLVALALAGSALMLLGRRADRRPVRPETPSSPRHPGG